MNGYIDAHAPRRIALNARTQRSHVLPRRGRTGRKFSARILMRRIDEWRTEQENIAIGLRGTVADQVLSTTVLIDSHRRGGGPGTPDIADSDGEIAGNRACPIIGPPRCPENVRLLPRSALDLVICTAYSDHPWEDVSRRVGDTDKLLILMKPFNSIEVVQLAHSLTKKWNLACSVKQQIQRLESSAHQRAGDWCEVNDRIQARIAMRMAEIEKDVPQGDAAESFREKEEFLAIMSYEILTSVNELASTVGLLLDGSLDPVQRAHATTIERCAQDLMALHTGMHEFMAGPRPEIRAGGRQ